MPSLAIVVAAITLTLTGAEALANTPPGTTPPGATPPTRGAVIEGADENLYAKHRLVLSLTSGLGTPTGFVGVDAEAALNESLAIAVGAGAGVNAGPQLSAMIRGRRPLSRHRAIGLGTGISYGDFNSLGTHIQDAWWFNAELYAESRSESGFVFRGFLGLGRATSYESCTEEPIFSDTQRECNPDNDFTVPYFGVSVGMAF